MHPALQRRALVLLPARAHGHRVPLSGAIVAQHLAEPTVELRPCLERVQPTERARGEAAGRPLLIPPLLQPVADHGLDHPLLAQGVHLLLRTLLRTLARRAL